MSALHRLTVAACIVLTVQAFMVAYSYWRIGAELETQLVTCVEARP